MDTYKKTPTERGMGLQCPRSDCNGRFIVNYSKFKKQKAKVGIITSLCPYCHKVSRLPNEDMRPDLRERFEADA